MKLHVKVVMNEKLSYLSGGMPVQTKLHDIEYESRTGVKKITNS